MARAGRARPYSLTDMPRPEAADLFFPSPIGSLIMYVLYIHDGKSHNPSPRLIGSLKN
jgi:hypothetical protein